MAEAGRSLIPYPLILLLLKQIIKLSCERYLTIPEGEDILVTTIGNLGSRKSVQTVIGKAKLLASSYFFICYRWLTPFVLSVLHKYIVFVVRYKSFLFMSFLQTFILLRAPIYAKIQ